MDEFDQWFADAITYTPGAVIRVQELVGKFRRTLEPDQFKHWPYVRFIHRLRDITGHLVPQGPLVVANVAWSRPRLEIGADRLLREED